jgi:uncharacterized lipoprotein YddW (UPF0748 family)
MAALMPWLAYGAAASGQTVVVDNVDPGCSVLSGNWSLGTTATGRYGVDYYFHITTGFGETTVGEIEWRPTLTEAGVYDVAVYYPQGTNRASDAPYTVYAADGPQTIPVNQQVGGGQWNSLGSFEFNAGTSGSVRLSSDAGPNVVIGDAVQFTLVDSPPGEPSFRGFWADAFHVGFKSTAQIDDMVSRAVAGNYNAIIAEVLAYQDNVGGGHGAYWNSSIIPKAADIVGNIDPLAYLCQQAHAAGIEVHAWLVTYRVSTTWPPSGNPLLAAHPEWMMTPRASIGTGPTPIATKYVLDPGCPEVQDYLVSIVREIVTNYPVDGINWDYIRYEQRDAGYPADASFTNSGLARFHRITGRSDVPTSTDSQWGDFRRRTIDELVRRCRVEISSITSNPRQPIWQTADLICFGAPAASFTSTDAYLLHQNWKYWLEKGWLDAGIPMNYKREHNVSHAQQYRDWINAALNYSSGRYIFCGQANYLNSKTNSITQLSYGLSQGAGGVVNYSYAATADENLDGNYEADWNWYPYVAANLFTSPVDTPPMHWRDPEVAAEGAIWGRVMDGISGEPIDDAQVEVIGFGTDRTDGMGYFAFTRVPAVAEGSVHSVRVVVPGESPVTRSGVLVYAGEPDGPTRVDFVVPPPLLYGDFDGNGFVDAADLPPMVFCLQGPTMTYGAAHFCYPKDADGDADVDLRDVAAFQRAVE